MLTVFEVPPSPRRIYSRDEQALVSCEGSISEHLQDRVLGFFSCRLNWNPPIPSPAGVCVPPPPLVPVGGHTRLRERGWGFLIQTREQTLWHSRYTCTLCTQGFSNHRLWICLCWYVLVSAPESVNFQDAQESISSCYIGCRNRFFGTDLYVLPL